MLSEKYLKENLGEFLFRTSRILYQPHGNPLKVLEVYGKKESDLTKITYDPNKDDEIIFINSISYKISSFERKNSHLLTLARKCEKENWKAQRTIEEIVLDEVRGIIDKKGNYKEIQKILNQYSTLKWDLEFIKEDIRAQIAERIFKRIPK